MLRKASDVLIFSARNLMRRISFTHLLVAMISASQELRAVCSWQTDIQAMRPPVLQRTKPDSDRNLNSSIGVPSSTAFPNYPPQQALLKVIRLWNLVGEYGVASVYASLS